MRVEEDRLRISVTDHAHAAVAFELFQLRLKFVPEIFIFQVVDPSPEPYLTVIVNQTGALGAEMRMIIRAVEHIINATASGNRTVKATHNGKIDKFLEQKQG